MHNSRRQFTIALTAISLSFLGLAPSAAAQDYPQRLIRVVVPFSAGGGTDIVARMLAEHLQNRFKQSVVVDNKPGGNTVIGMDFVAKAPPDGYTLGFVSSSFSTVPLTSSRSFSPQQFTPVAQVAAFPLVLVTHAKSPFQSVAEVVAFAKANPGKLTYGVSAQGGADHMTGELFKMRAGIDVRTIPYKGASQALTDLVGGQIDLRWDTLPGTRSLIEAGQLRALGVTSLTRSALAPQIPSIFESGLAPFDVPFYFGLVAPAGLSTEIAKKLSDEVNVFVRQPLVQERMQTLGLLPQSNTPSEFAEYLKQNEHLWSRVVRDAKIAVDQ